MVKLITSPCYTLLVAHLVPQPYVVTQHPESMRTTMLIYYRATVFHVMSMWWPSWNCHIIIKWGPLGPHALSVFTTTPLYIVNAHQGTSTLHFPSTPKWTNPHIHYILEGNLPKVPFYHVHRCLPQSTTRSMDMTTYEEGDIVSDEILPLLKCRLIPTDGFPRSPNVGMIKMGYPSLKDIWALARVSTPCKS